LLGCGENTVRFCPPLVITREDVKTAVNIVSSMLTEMEAELEPELHSSVNV
jgi:4-aminobutyrate aminotransferase-like enzyme